MTPSPHPEEIGKLVERLNDAVRYSYLPHGLRGDLEQAASALTALVEERDAAQETVRAWSHVVSSLEAHIMDRAAMKDPANPEAYLRILQAEVANVTRSSEQMLASRWSDYRSNRDQIERLEAERDRLREALQSAQTVLAMMVNPETIKTTTVLHAYAQAVEAETRARQALKEADHG